VGVKRLLLPLMIVLVASTLSPIATRTAHACTPLADFDVVDDSEVIVGGRFTGFTIDESIQFPNYFEDDQESIRPLYDVPFRAHMRVERVFKGEAPSEIDIADNSLDVYDHNPRYVWTGAHGACGTFYEDPTNQYGIIGLSLNDDGTYNSWFFGWLFLDYEPEGERYEDAHSRLTAIGPSVPMRPPNAASFPEVPAAVAASLGPLVFLAGAAFVWRGKGGAG